MKTSKLFRPIAAIIGLAGISLAGSLAQPSASGPHTPPPNGPRRADPTAHILSNATVHVAPGETIERAQVTIRDGRIEWVGSLSGRTIALDGYRVWDCTGLHVYPGLIDPYVEVEAPELDADAAGAHWNDNVTPQRRVTSGDGIPAADASALRKLGFVAAGLAPNSGTFRGAGAVVSLAEPPEEGSAAEPPVYNEDTYQALSLASGGRGGGYPSSQMGAIALVRQTLLDADWRETVRETADVEPSCLDELSRRHDPLLLFTVRDELEALRAAKIGDEFDRPIAIVGSGDEYKRLDAIAELERPFVLPLDYPKAPSLGSLGEIDAVSLTDLMEWEQAPTNARRLIDAGVDVSLTSSKAKSRSDFHKKLRTAIEHGLAEHDALAALTTRPARLLGVEDDLGAIEVGRVASLVVADGPLFHEDTKIRDLWIDGRRHEINPAPPPDASGVWSFTFGMGPEHDGTLILEIDEKGKAKARLEGPDGEPSVKARNVKWDGAKLSYLVDNPDGTGTAVSTAVVEGKEMLGQIVAPDGSVMSWTATRTGDVPESEDQPQPEAEDDGSNDARSGAEAAAPADPVTGRWAMVARNDAVTDPVPFTLNLALEEDGVVSGSLSAEIGELPVTVGSFDGRTVRLDFGGVAQAHVTVDGNRAEGQATYQANVFEITGSRGEGTAVASDAARDAGNVPDLPGYPFGPYAYGAPPPQESFVIRNATIWTCGPEGIIDDGFVVVVGGKILAVGEGEFAGDPPAGARFIDAQGKHLTPGIIDCHSHTGISGGVNEGTQAATAEVRIGDVTNPDTVNWYRQLAGGVTTVNSLHGSANPIGGQNQVNKIRWGCAHPDDMHFEGAPSGIKFALGENVKQSNWGDSYTTRYPQTRMGVETIIRDRFIAAREYADAWGGFVAQKHDDGAKQMESVDRTIAALQADGVPDRVHLAVVDDPPSSAPPRRDLELEALAEILAGERLVHCHSYRQDEILMLCRVAEEFGFTIGTFQHVLEGYKVAEAIREQALGASAFADWWAYKVEVQDAIPHNGAIMHEQGVVVSYNSDSDELARRLNTEATKAVRYGGVSPEEALKFVTLNPAVQLGIEDRVGSIEPGKDADLALWSGDPLSTFTRCEATFIDGREYFSIERDAELRERIRAERQRLIQKLIAKKGDGDTEAAEEDEPKDTDSPTNLVDTPPEELEHLREIERRYLDMLNRGIDPEAHRCGDCGLTFHQEHANRH